MHRAGGHQVQKAFHVALLGPADVAHRIVNALLFVGRVVTTRPVRTRQAQLQLLLVVRVARNVQANHPDRHDDRPVARQARCEYHRVARIRGGGDEDRIGAAAERERAHLLHEVRVGAQARRVSAD